MTTRIVTGAVIGVLAVVLIVQGGLVFFAAMFALALVAAAEFYRLTRRYRPLALAGFLGVILIVYMAGFRSPEGVLGGVVATVGLVAVAGLLAGPKPGVCARMAVTLLGALYVGLGFGALIMLRRFGDGAALVGIVVFGTWAGDTMAYFTGRWFGATPMAPKLSPKKTWEGFAGGCLGTIVLVLLIGMYTDPTPFESLVLGAVIAVVGPAGDLFESLVKRDVQIKDSGRGLPGHGGVLDRFDALLWASLAAYFVVTAVLGF